MKKYKANSYPHLLLLETLIREVTKDELKASKFAYLLIIEGFMYMNWVQKFVVWFLVKVRKFKRTSAIWAISSSKKLSQDLINQAIQWMLGGTDTVDKNSVGGFSQKEINRLTEILLTLDKNTI